MSGANGRADPRAGPLVNNVEHSALTAPLMNTPPVERFSAEKIRALVAELEVPFDPSVIEWRITNTANGQQRGLVVPYADQRAYTDRLNEMFTPAGWTRKYAVHTTANFERARDKKIVAKVLITCELMILGLGSHSATGEEWADNDNACTAAEAQAFKRACSCFGLGRYLYHFTGVWIDLDERKRPNSIPRLFGWATPQGWRQGQRPAQQEATRPCVSVSKERSTGETDALIRDIEAMADAIGKRLYRGVLKTVARVWNPTEIRDPAILQRVLTEMCSADADLRRLDEALSRVEPDTLTPILRSFRLNSLDQLDSLDSLRKVVREVERAGN
ncbi:MAG: Rad52/Rad22 family DNA repair protein [Terriglobales bacterium]